eukprot:7293190-Prymnesium_polylepis.1
MCHRCSAPVGSTCLGPAQCTAARWTRPCPWLHPARPLRPGCPGTPTTAHCTAALRRPDMPVPPTPP